MSRGAIQGTGVAVMGRWASLPRPGDPCDAANICNYTEPGCNSPTMAVCWKGAWGVNRCTRVTDAAADVSDARLSP